MGIGDFIAGHQPRAERAEGVEAFALVPGAAALQLPLAFRHVVDDAITGDVLHGVRLIDVAPAFADDHAEFDFPIGLERAARDLDVVIGAADGTGPFAEDDRLFRHFHVRLGRMVGVVQTDADKFTDLPDTGTDPWLPFNEGQA